MDNGQKKGLLDEAANVMAKWAVGYCGCQLVILFAAIVAAV